jgi:putative two-component system response regulator
MGATEDEQRGLALGAVDYMTKPLRPAIVLARVQHPPGRCAPRTRRLQLRQRRRSKPRSSAACARTRSCRKWRIRALARLAETRDNETGNHILRTQAYVRRLAQLLCDAPELRRRSSTNAASR